MGKNMHKCLFVGQNRHLEFWRPIEAVMQCLLLKGATFHLSADINLFSLILIWVRGGDNFTPCWFSLNDSETVKTVTLAFCSIQ